MDYNETYEKCPAKAGFKFKEKTLTAGVYGIIRGLIFDPNIEIGQISANFEKWRFAKISL